MVPPQVAAAKVPFSAGGVIVRGRGHVGMDGGTASSLTNKSERGSDSHYARDLNECAIPCPASFWRGESQLTPRTLQPSPDGVHGASREPRRPAPGRLIGR
jgi:hypothetical protein